MLWLKSIKDAVHAGKWLVELSNHIEVSAETLQKKLSGLSPTHKLSIFEAQACIDFLAENGADISAVRAAFVGYFDSLAAGTGTDICPRTQAIQAIKEVADVANLLNTALADNHLGDADMQRCEPDLLEALNAMNLLVHSISARHARDTAGLRRAA